MATMRAKSICNAPACGKLIDAPGYCAKHAHIPKQYKAAREEKRESSHARGYSSQWRKARIGYLAKHPLCCECNKQGLVVAANVVDHVIPHQGNKALFWNSDNWQALCKQCHDRKTAREDAGFGNTRKTQE